jgi:5-methylcytosine-specific restriction protein B
MSAHQLNKIKFKDSLQKYINACTETDWLIVGELYKFRFAKWLHDRIDFSTQEDDEILKISIESQNEKFDGHTKGLNFLVSSRRFGKEVIDVKDIRIIRDMFNGGEISKGKVTGTLPLTKFSVWLATMLPEKFNTCPKIDLIHSLEYLFDKKGLPQKGYESFIQSQELLKILRSEIHQNIELFRPVSSKIPELKIISPVIEVWLVQDFIFFVRNRILVDSEMFTWVPVFEELASKLLSFRNDQLGIIQRLINAGITVGFNDINKNNQKIQLREIDPFTVFASITKFGIDKVLEIIPGIIKNFYLKSSVPKDAVGIPKTFPQNVWYFAYEKDRDPEVVPALWDLYEQAMRGNIDENLFLKVLKFPGLGIAKLTSSLFKAQPDKYLTIDRNTTYYLKSINIEVEIKSLQDYLELIRKVREKTNLKLYEISHIAYMENVFEEDVNIVADSETDYSKEARYWIYSPGSLARYWDSYYNEGIMAIGPNELGNLSMYESREKIGTKFKEIRDPEVTHTNDSLACWQFLKVMKPGDIIIPKKGVGFYLGYGIIESDYYFDPGRSDYHHLRKVKWMSKGEWPEIKGKIVIKMLTDVTKYPEYVIRLKDLIGIPNSNIPAEKPILIPIRTSETQYWWLNANAKYWNIDNYQLGQVQSYTTHNDSGNKRRIYEYFRQVKPGDLIIGYQTTPSLKIKALFEATSGITEDEEAREVISFNIKEFFPYQAAWEELKENRKINSCEVFVNNQGSLFKLSAEEFNAITELCRNGPVVKLTPYKIENALTEVFLSEEGLTSILHLLDYKKNLILQGPPGTGKTFIAKRLAYLALGYKDASKIEMVQFHQSYSYEDFIQGYRPCEGNSFILQNGIFFEFCLKAQHDPDHKYFFIIDEINRGNLSKIFGELMMLIEHDKRGREFGIKMTYSRQDSEKFYIPENLYIIGTMNTADRSLAIVDYALRRRFVFIDMKPAFSHIGFTELLMSYNVSDSLIAKIRSRMEDLNAIISGDDNLGKWFSVGHSYFCSKNKDREEDWYNHIITNEIGPLLKEYWFDDEEKANENINKLNRV